MVFILEIPLVEKQMYQYFQLYSLPIKTNNSYQIIIPQSKYVALNEQSYVFSDDKCKSVTDSKYLRENVNKYVSIKNKNIPC